MSEPQCNGICLWAADVGVPVVTENPAYPHPSCPAHGDPEAWEAEGQAIVRADERAKCRAELVSELNTRAMLDMTDKYEDLIRWARTEAFGGE